MKKIILFAGIVALLAIVAYVLLSAPVQNPDQMDDENYWAQFDDPLAQADLNVNYIPTGEKITIQVENLLQVPGNCQYEEVNSHNSLYNIWFTTSNAKKYAEYNCLFAKGAIVVLSVTEFSNIADANDFMGYMTDYGQYPAEEKLGDAAAKDIDGTFFFIKGVRVFSLFRSTDAEDLSLVATHGQLMALAEQINRTN